MRTFNAVPVPLVSCLLLGVALAACGGAVVPGSGEGGSSGAAPGPTTPPAHPDPTPPAGPPLSGPGAPPAPPTPSPSPSSAIRTFAVSRFFLGDTTRAGAPSTSAWKSYGYNLDGKISTKASADVCTPSPGAGNFAQVDGDLGIDNAWGARIVPILQTFQHDVSKQLTGEIDAGRFTYLLETAGLSDSPAQTNTNVVGQLFAGGQLATSPTFTPADHWPALASSLATGTLSGGAKTRFPNAYMNGGVWVDGQRGDVRVTVAVGDKLWPFTVHHAIVSFEHPTPSHLGNGTIAGVVPAQELIASLRAIAGTVSDSLCSGTAFDSIAQQVVQAADMRADGTNGPGATCDAISIGVGFEADEIANVSAVQPDPPPLPNPCP